MYMCSGAGSATGAVLLYGNKPSKTGFEEISISR